VTAARLWRGASWVPALQPWNKRAKPSSDLIEHAVENIPVGSARLGANVERVIRIVDDGQGCAIAELLNDWPEKRQICQVVSASLQEQHRDVHLGQMFAARAGGLFRPVQGETEEHQSPNLRQGRLRLSLRGHPATEGFASGK